MVLISFRIQTSWSKKVLVISVFGSRILWVQRLHNIKLGPS
jgi:hypothetical protein